MNSTSNYMLRRLCTQAMLTSKANKDDIYAQLGGKKLADADQPAREKLRDYLVAKLGGYTYLMFDANGHWHYAAGCNPSDAAVYVIRSCNRALVSWCFPQEGALYSEMLRTSHCFVKSDTSERDEAYRRVMERKRMAKNYVEEDCPASPLNAAYTIKDGRVGGYTLATDPAVASQIYEDGHILSSLEIRQANIGEEGRPYWIVQRGPTPPNSSTSLAEQRVTPLPGPWGR